MEDNRGGFSSSEGWALGRGLPGRQRDHLKPRQGRPRVLKEWGLESGI